MEVAHGAVEDKTVYRRFLAAV